MFLLCLINTPVFHAKNKTVGNGFLGYPWGSSPEARRWLWGTTPARSPCWLQTHRPCLLGSALVIWAVLSLGEADFKNCEMIESWELIYGPQVIENSWKLGSSGVEDVFMALLCSAGRALQAGCGSAHRKCANRHSAEWGLLAKELQPNFRQHSCGTEVIPSGKHTRLYETSPFLNG